MIADSEIDQALLRHTANEWRKVARVVMSAMSELGDRHQGRSDLYFAGRVAFLAVTGVVEYIGDLGKMGCCEVRLPQKKS